MCSVKNLTGDPWLGWNPAQGQERKPERVSFRINCLLRFLSVHTWSLQQGNLLPNPVFPLGWRESCYEIPSLFPLRGRRTPLNGEFCSETGHDPLVPLSREPSAHGHQPLLVPLCPNLSSPQLLPHGGLAQIHRGHQLASPFDSNTKLPVPI